MVKSSLWLSAASPRPPGPEVQLGDPSATGPRSRRFSVDEEIILLMSGGDVDSFDIYLSTPAAASGLFVLTALAGAH